MRDVNSIYEAAEGAARLLKSDIFLHSVINAEAEIIYEWRNASSVEDREQAHSDLRALRRVVSKVEGIMAAHPSARRAAELSQEVDDARQADLESGQAGDELNGD